MKYLRWGIAGGVGIVAATAALVACVGDGPTNTPTDGGSSDVVAQSDGSKSDAGDSGITCNAPTLNCGGVCLDVTGDKLNCGKCGRSCGTATCTAGKCGVVQVASGLTLPYRIRSMTTPNVVVVTSSEILKDGGAPNGGLFRIPKPSGTATRMWTDPTYAMKSIELDVAGANAYCYAYNGTGQPVVFAEIDINGNPTSTPTGIAFPAITPAFQYVAATSTDAGTAVMAQSAGATHGRVGLGAMTQAFTSLGGAGVAMPTTGDLVWIDVQAIRTCKRTNPVTACNPANGSLLAAGGPSAKLLRAFGDTVYWASDSGTSTIFACKLPSCPTPKVIASGEANLGDLAVDESGVYWTDPISGRVRVCTDLVNGCAGNAVTLVDSQANVLGITTDATNVYWTINATPGFVRSTAK